MKKLCTSVGFLILYLAIYFSFQIVKENFYRGEKSPSWITFSETYLVYLPWLLAIPGLLLTYRHMKKNEFFTLNFLSLLAWGYVLGKPFIELAHHLYLQYYLS